MPSDDVTFYHYDGYGVEAKNVHYYSQAARVGDRIETSGQGAPGAMFALAILADSADLSPLPPHAGGWDPKTGKCRTTIEEEIKQAFENVELTLKTAGGKGWEQVGPCSLVFHAPGT